MCCGRGAYLNRRKICLENTPEQDEEERTPSYPKVKNKASTSCTACSKLVENFKDSLLPRLAARQKIIRKSHSRSKLAASGTVGDLESIVEEEISRICLFPRTHNIPRYRKGCEKLIEEHEEQIVIAISSWARDGSYGLHKADVSDGLVDELRPALCEHELELCTEADLAELERVDADEAEKLKEANETGHVDGKPMESERPSNAKTGTLVRVVSKDFFKRIVEDGADVDYLLYMFFPGRNVETADTHSKLRSKYVRLAEFLDATNSNGSLVVGWMDCVFNVIPPPFGTHVHSDTIVLYPARSKTRPSYWTDLRDGDVDIKQLVDFVGGASANEAARKHVSNRIEELSQRGVYEALPSNLMVFMDSLSVDERKVSPLNLTSTKEAMLNDDLGDFFYKRHKELLGYEPHKRDEDYPGFLPPKKGQGFKVEL